MITRKRLADDVMRTVSLHYTLLLPTFVATIFVSAALLFAVQPMFTKMVLPRLGGAASVWSMAMVFFQTTLLAGYVYAHLLTRFTSGRSAVAIHLAVMLLASVALPLHIATGWGRAPAAGEALWLLGLFAASIGLPFFALASNGPLLQAWFVRTNHSESGNPYFLYAASNAGSFLALISYPLVIEPFVRLGDQAWLWTIGFYVLILLIGCCGTLLLRSRSILPIRAAASAVTAAPSSWRDVANWVGLAAVPSGLLLAVTAHISTDVAAVPLLWVLPLSLYLLTFVIAFQTRPFIPHRIVIRIFPASVLVLVAFMAFAPTRWVVSLIAVDTMVFFVTALMCHGELARRRPAPGYLTGFYMWISIGGMIGGVATGLVAPNVFSWVAEYPLLVVLAMLCLPRLAQSVSRTWEYLLIGALSVAALILLGLDASGAKISAGIISLLGGVVVGSSVYFWRKPLPFAAMIAFFLFINYTNFGYHHHQNFSVRNFFGVLSAVESPDGRFRVLWHGTIGQGAQRIRDDSGHLLTGRPKLVSEFFDGAGIAQTVDAVRARVGGPIRYAVIGLGTGAMTCRAHPGDSVTYYEIDPDVIRVARDPKLFNYISECGPHTRIVQGDARLTLQETPDGSYDMILVDAFLGAAIPTHLLTREAMAIYLRKLNPNGIVAIHVSNRSLELASVVAGIADANGAITRVYEGGDVKENADEFYWVPKVAAVARKEEDFGVLAESKYWPTRSRDLYEAVWSDDYSNIVGAMIRKLRDQQK